MDSEISYSPNILKVLFFFLTYWILFSIFKTNYSFIFITMISKTCQYALRAIIYIAQKNGSKFIPVKEIAAENNISHFFLGKIMTPLSRKGLIVSYKGPNGGVKLAKPADEITLLDIVEAVDGIDFKTECFLGLECRDDKSCVVHKSWKEVKEKYIDMLSNNTIAKILENS